MTRVEGIPLEASYDERANAVYIRFKRGQPVRTEIVDLYLKNASIHIDFHGDSQEILGIEILGARNVLPPECLRENDPTTE
jgi:uncharacterized protein YuzE